MRIFYTGFFVILSFSVLSQTIVNTEKLFHDDEDGLAFASELIGSTMQGNAQLYLLESSLNLRYKNKKHTTKLFTGGSYVNENAEVISNSLFGQLRYNYLINSKSQFFSFYQLQTNKILLLKSRQLIGAGYRRSLFHVGTDSTSSLKFDCSIGAMQEEENLNALELGLNDQVYSNYTRGIISAIISVKLGNGVSVVNTIYIQSKITDLSDYRLLNETNLIFEINKWLAISLDIEYRYDGDPPSVLKPSDLNTNMGFVLSL